MQFLQDAIDFNATRTRMAELMGYKPPDFFDPQLGLLWITRGPVIFIHTAGVMTQAGRYFTIRRKTDHGWTIAATITPTRFTTRGDPTLTDPMFDALSAWLATQQDTSLLQNIHRNNSLYLIERHCLGTVALKVSRS